MANGKDIKSIASEWESLKQNYNSGSEVCRACDYITNAFPYMEDAVAEVASIDGVGPLNSFITEAEIENLQDAITRARAFCENIHDDASTLLDSPFLSKMTIFLDEIFALSPKNVTLEKAGVFGIVNEVSLFDLVKPNIDDKALKKDFNTKAKILHEMPSKTLQQAIVDALAKSNMGKDINTIYAPDIQLLIKYYETLFPYEAMLFNELFEDVEKTKNVLGNIAKIKYLAYSSPEPYHSVFFDNLMMAEMGHTKPYEKEVNGVMETQNKFGFYQYGRVNIDLTTGDSYWTCRVFFHEYGHYLDALHGKVSVALNDTIYSDVYDNIEAEIRKHTTDINEVNIILESLKEGGTEFPSDQTLNNYYRNEVIEYYNNIQNGVLWDNKAVVASDVYGGVTNNNIHGKWYHFPDIKTDYERYYWYDINGNPTSAQHREFFAESFSNGMTQNSEAISSANIFFPNTNNELNDLITSMANK